MKYEQAHPYNCSRACRQRLSECLIIVLFHRFPCKTAATSSSSNLTCHDTNISIHLSLSPDCPISLSLIATNRKLTEHHLPCPLIPNRRLSSFLPEHEPTYTDPVAAATALVPRPRSKCTQTAVLYFHHPVDCSPHVPLYNKGCLDCRTTVTSFVRHRC